MAQFLSSLVLWGGLIDRWAPTTTVATDKTCECVPEDENERLKISGTLKNDSGPQDF